MILVLLAAGYLIGAIPTGLVIIRLLRGVDIRTVGSGNIGATNVYRVAGLPTAVLVLLVDALKGVVPVVLARASAGPLWSEAAAGLAAIIGHNWSVFLGFTGGKGIATSFGVLVALSPVAAAVAAGIWGVVLVISRYVSVASILAIASLPVVMWARGEPPDHLVFALAALVFAIYRHRANLARLRAGTEPRITEVPRSGLAGMGGGHKTGKGG